MIQWHNTFNKGQRQTERTAGEGEQVFIELIGTALPILPCLFPVLRTPRFEVSTAPLNFPLFSCLPLSHPVLETYACMLCVSRVLYNLLYLSHLNELKGPNRCKMDR
jgi:hypothetical protein